MKNTFIITGLLLVFAACNTIEQIENVRTKEKEVLDDFRIVHSMAPLSQEEAVTVAQRFALLNGVQTKVNEGKVPGNVVAIDGKQGTPAMYAVNYGTNDGFVLLNTSKKFFPVLAFSETGHFTQDRDVSGLDVWLNQQQALIEAAETLPLDSLKEVTKAWRNYEYNAVPRIITKSGDDPLEFREDAIAEWELEGYECMDLETSASYLSPYIYNQWCELAEEQSDPTYDYMESAVVLYYGTSSSNQVGPLMSTLWGQKAPYNLATFPDNTPMPPSGSAIAAMAQIMRYYEWPTIYDWSTMSDTTATYDTKILYRNLKRDANTDNNGDTDIDDLKDAITGYLYHYHYNASVVNHSLTVAKNNVNSGKPVFMEGKATGNEKRAWVCDGRKTSTTANHLILMVYTPDERYMQAENGGYYSDSNSTDYLHMNWGEDGVGNGWFSGDNCTFSRYVNNVWTQTNYSSNRKDIVNITPDD